MKNKKRKRNKDGKLGERCLMVFLVILVLFFGGIWIGKFIYNKNNTVEASAYGSNKATNTNSNASVKPNVDKIDKNEKDNSKSEKQEEVTKNQDSQKNEEVNKNEEPTNTDNKVEDTVVLNNNSNNSNNYDYAVNVEDAYKKDGKKVAFLTFDDGPSRNNTPQVLDTLNKYGIKATFCIIGKMAEQNPDLVLRIHKEGHAIANHSYTHDYNKVYASSNSFWDEINKTDAVLKGILGQDFNTRIFRFPGGSIGGNYEKLKAVYRNEMKDRGGVYIDWNVENGDGRSSNFSPATLLQYVKQESQGKDHIVILMHDAAAKKTTAEALPSVIEYLKSQGYEFKVLK